MNLHYFFFGTSLVKTSINNSENDNSNNSIPKNVDNVENEPDSASPLSATQENMTNSSSDEPNILLFAAIGGSLCVVVLLVILCLILWIRKHESDDEGYIAPTGNAASFTEMNSFQSQRRYDLIQFEFEF